MSDAIPTENGGRGYIGFVDSVQQGFDAKIRVGVPRGVNGTNNTEIPQVSVEASKKETTRDTVLKTVQKAHRDFGESVLSLQNKTEDTLSSHDKKKLSQYKIVDAGLKLTENGQKQLEHQWEHDGKSFTSTEGVPVEGLVWFIDDQIMELSNASRTPTSEELDKIRQLEQDRDLLLHNSKDFYDTSHPERQTAEFKHTRTALEAKYISEDPLRKDSDLDNDQRMKNDWSNAEDALNKRRELVLPEETSNASMVVVNGGDTSKFKPNPEIPEQVLPEYDSGNRDTIEPGVEPGSLGDTTTPDTTTPDTTTPDTTTPDTTTPDTTTPDTTTPDTTTPDTTTSETPEEKERREFLTERKSIENVNYEEEWSQLGHQGAREEFYRKLKEAHLRDPRTWPLFIRNIGIRLGEGGFIHRYKTELLSFMHANNCAFPTLEIAKDAARKAEFQAKSRTSENATVERFGMEDKGGKLRTGEKRETITGQLRKDYFEQVLNPIIDGSVTTVDQVRDKLLAYVTAHRGDATIEAMFSESENTFRDATEAFASNVLEQGQTIKEGLEKHKVKLADIDGVIDIRLGYARATASTDTRDYVDRVIIKAHDMHNRILEKYGARVAGAAGFVLNPFVMGVGISSIYKVGSSALRVGGKLASIPTFMVGGGVGALVGGVRRYRELGNDRAYHNLARALGEQLPDAPAGNWIQRRLNRLAGAERQLDLEKYGYTTAKSVDLINGGGNEILTGTTRKSTTELLADLDTDTGRDAAARRIAEIQTRMDLSTGQRIDLLEFKNRETGESEGLMPLVKATVELRQAMIAVGMTDADIDVKIDTQKGLWKSKFITNKEQQDGDFNRYRLGQALGAGVFGGATGMIGSLVSQSFFANIARANPSLHTAPIIGGLFKTGPTEWEHIRVVIAHKDINYSLPSLGAFKDAYGWGGNIHVDDQTQAVVDKATHLVTFKDAHGAVISGIPKTELGANGALKIEGDIASLPKNIKDAISNWEVKPLLGVKHVGEQMLEAAQNNQQKDLFIGKMSVHVDGQTDTVTFTDTAGNKATGTIDTQGIHFASQPDKAMLSEIQKEMGSKGFTVGAISESLPIRSGSSLDQVKNALTLSSHEVFQQGDVQVDVDGSTGVVTLHSLTTNDILHGHVDPSTYEFVISSKDNGFLDSPREVNEINKLLNAAGFGNVSNSTLGGATKVVKNAINLDPADLSKNHIIDTTAAAKSWNFHVLRPDIVSATGDHTHNELTLHIAQYVNKAGEWISGKPGILNTGADVNGDLIPSNLPGVVAQHDAVLDALIAKNGSIKHEDMVFVVDLINGQQITLKADDIGNAMLPKELFDPKTGAVKGIKYIAATVLEKPDGTLLKGDELLKLGKMPDGIIVHSLASEKFGEPEIGIGTPTRIIKALTPDDYTTSKVYGLDAIPGEGTQFIEVTPPESAPGIPTPFTPRHPLGEYESSEITLTPYGPYGNRRRISDEYRTYYPGKEPDWTLYRQRRSPRLVNDSEAQLNLQQEGEWYLSQVTPEYKNKIIALASQTPPMNNKVKAVVCMPVAAHQEERTVYNGLSRYLNQVDASGTPIDSESYEIVIYLNRPTTKLPDGTENEIHRFMNDHPEVPVRVIKAELDPSDVLWGKIVGALNDTVLYRSLQRPNPERPDFIMLTNDVDVTAISPKYITSFVEEFDKPENKHVDGLLGKLEWSQEVYDRYPVFHAATRFWQYVDNITRHGTIDENGVKRPNVGSPGATFGIRASTYAGIGGYLQETGAGADQELSWMIKAARSKDNQIPLYVDNYPIKMLNRAWLETSPRRGLDYYLRGQPIVHQWADWDKRARTSDPAREKRFQDMLRGGESLRNFNVVRLESEMNALLDLYGYDAENPVVKKALGFMRVKYQILPNKKIKLTDISELKKGLQEYKDKGYSQLKKRGTQAPNP